MSDKRYSIGEIKSKITPIAKEYGVDAIYLFGSYATGKADENSDVDFRVEKGAVRGIQFAGLYAALEEALDKHIDLVTSASLDDQFKQKIADEEVLVYAK